MTEPTPPIEHHPPTSSSSSNPPPTATTTTTLPRITIKYCTQCKWMLRAAYFAQELLSTFSTALGEVALVPCTGGTFIVSITAVSASASAPASGAETEMEMDVQERVLWDRRVDGGFPEVKVLKSRVRDVIDPHRDLGHTDRALRQGQSQRLEKEADKCEDCQT